MIKRIEELEDSIDDKSRELLENCKTELYDIRNDKLKGYMVRAKAQYIDQGEKPTKFFCGLEKHNYSTKIMGQVEKEDGSIIMDQKGILEEAEYFYRSLYENKDDQLKTIDLEEYMKDTNMTKLTNTEADKLEGLLT